jgi:hypothetical protein
MADCCQHRSRSVRLVTVNCELVVSGGHVSRACSMIGSTTEEKSAIRRLMFEWNCLYFTLFNDLFSAECTCSRCREG